ncbi:hypothetical protein L6164_034045 [Bauhinia variegata]|uniref:Uncharacterized protein n=1 Tax=Bauhinia variegata TaxID=167791 RepID=A0ACB9KU61_BAUVA|nr:hypothetical protein L6164_034045 [Bauhinia variegata]
MKASLKFRDEQKPLFRAKVPLNILGLPFQSGVVAGESKELTLNLGTFLESGPSIRIAYRPNDSWNPFSLIVKTGTGPFGSPISSSMVMSAEFNLLGRGNGTPAFMLHFKPRFGDFTFKKLQSSIFDKKVFKAQNGAASDDDGSIEVVDSPVNSGHASFSGKKLSILATDSPATGVITNMLSGMEVAARTTVPVRGRAVLNFRWGVRLPAELKSRDSATAGIAFHKIPFLVMDKIGVEHVDGSDSKGKGSSKKGTELGNANVAETCLIVKRQLEVLQAENGLLRNAVEDLRREIAGGWSFGGSEFGKYREIERNGTKSSNGKADRRNNEKKSSDFNSIPGKSMEADVNEELKKALKGATGP